MSSVSICVMFPVLDAKLSGALGVSYKVAKAVAESGLKLKILDYKSGLLHKMLTDEGCCFDFIDLSLKGWDSYIDESDVVFGFNNDIYNYPFFFRNNPYVYFYDVYPPFWHRFLKPKGIGLIGSDKFLRSISRRGFFDYAISVMEAKSKYNIASRFPDASVERVSVIPVSIRVDVNSFNFKLGDRIRVTYIGRSEAWKISPLAKLMKDVAIFGLKERVLFNVVVSDILFAKKLLKDEGVTIDSFNINFYENISKNDLSEVIRLNTDIGYAMGTAALEFGAHGVPTILADFSEKTFPDEYKYKWIFEVDGFTLGLDLSDCSNSERISQGVTIDKIIDRFINEPLVISKKCYAYVSEFHSEASNYSKLVELIASSRFKAFYLKSYQTFLFYFLQWVRKFILSKKKYER